MKLEHDRQRITLGMGRGLALFGVPFALMGGWVVHALLTGGQVTVNGRPGTPADVWLPGIFVVVGLVLTFARYGTVIDLRAGEVSRSFSILVPLWRQRAPLGRLESVTLRREIRRNKNSSYVVYPVDIAATEQTISVSSRRNAQRARAEGERLAKLLQIPLRDTSEGELLVRGPHELDLSVLETEEVPAHRPTAPKGCDLWVSEEGGRTTIKLGPAGPVVMRTVLLFVAVVVFFGGFWHFVWWDGFDAQGEPATVLFGLAPLLLGGLVLLANVVAGLGQGLLGTALEVERGELRVRRLLRGARFSSAELEELRHGKDRTGSCLIARSDEREARFGHGLPFSHRQHIRELVLYSLRRG